MIVTFHKPCPPYFGGERADFTDEIANRMIQAGVAKADIPIKAAATPQETSTPDIQKPIQRRR
jgi:hypothetical protein